MTKGIKIWGIIQVFISMAVFAQDDSTTIDVTEPNIEFSADLFQNIHVKKGEESAKISWSINHDIYTQLKESGAELIITYNTKIGKKRAKNNHAGGDWMFTKKINLDETSYKFENLIGNETYYFKLGIAKDGNVEVSKDDKSTMIWAHSVKVKTERAWGIAKLLILIGALGFLFSE